MSVEILSKIPDSYAAASNSSEQAFGSKRQYENKTYNNAIGSQYSSDPHYKPYNLFPIAGKQIKRSPEIESNLYSHYDKRNKSLTVDKQFFAHSDTRNNDRLAVHTAADWGRLNRLSNKNTPVNGMGHGQQLWRGYKFTTSKPAEYLVVADPHLEQHGVNPDHWGNAPGTRTHATPISYENGGVHPTKINADATGTGRPDIDPMSLQLLAAQQLGLDNDYAPLSAVAFQNLQQTMNGIVNNPVTKEPTSDNPNIQPTPVDDDDDNDSRFGGRLDDNIPYTINNNGGGRDIWIKH